jgi:hypothetical protein
MSLKIEVNQKSYCAFGPAHLAVSSSPGLSARRVSILLAPLAPALIVGATLRRVSIER